MEEQEQDICRIQDFQQEAHRILGLQELRTHPLLKRCVTDRQQDILSYISGASEPVTQTQVGEALELAKSSVSRNVDTLVKKGYVLKENVGMSSYLSVKKED